METATKTSAGINLKPFCSTDEGRPRLWRPFTIQDYTYATDGRILVRVRKQDDAPMQEYGVGVEADHIKLAMKAFPSEIAVDWLPLPTFDDTTPNAEKCLECDGTGKHEKVFDVTIGNRTLDRRYVRMMVALPELRLSLGYGGEMDALAFRFKGGRGLLMPRKKGGA